MQQSKSGSLETFACCFLVCVYYYYYSYSFIVITIIMGDVAGLFKGPLFPFLNLLHQQRSEMSRDRYQVGFEYGVKLVEGLP